MKIKISRIKEVYVYLFVIFIVMKVWRAFSGSTEHGGFWNYIQIFYIFIGFFIFVKFINVIKNETAVFIIAIYSLITFMISALTLYELNISNLFELIKVPFMGMTAIIFYMYRVRNGTLNNNTLLIKVTFYSASAILCFRLGYYMLSGGIRSSGAGAVADVYFILGMLPYILAITEEKYQIIPIAVTAISVLISQKRAGFLALVGLIVIFYFIESLHSKSMYITIRNIVVLTLLIIAGYYLMVYMDSKFNLRLFIRLKMLETDGGSGRDIKWRLISEEIKKSNIFQLLFGHGFNGVKSLIGSHAHNDFLEVLYNFGFISLILYCSFFFTQIYNGVRMVKAGYSHAAEFICSVFVSLCIAMFSYYVIDATYAICGCFTQGILLADWRINQKEVQQ